VKPGGVILRLDAIPVFLPAGIVLEVTSSPRITRVPGAPAGLLGIALHEGEILPVVSVGSKAGPMVVCTYQGEHVGLMGAEIVHAGLVDEESASPEIVTYEGERVRVLDLAPIFAQIRGVSWAGRWVG
jgi:CheW-like protein